MSEFKILSLNCRGLHDVNKRKDVFKYLREQNASLYCLQDTHCTENDKSVVYAQWGLDFLMSPGNSNSRGTLTLTNNNFEMLSRIPMEITLSLVYLLITNTL